MASKGDFFLREFTKELILNTKILFPEKFQLNIPQQNFFGVTIIKPAQIQNPAIANTSNLNTLNLNPQAGIVSAVAPKTAVVSSIPATSLGFIPVGNAFNLAKINELVRDNSINSIEAIGVGKPLLIRKMRGGQAIVTKIMLTKEESNEILNFFSIQARIPRIGGIFRAIVGNLLITAVDSEFGGGPKFVISKVA